MVLGFGAVAATTATAATTVTAAPAAAPPTGGSLGSNVIVFSPSESATSIAAQANAIAAAQDTSQFGTARYALLFEPGTYGSAAAPLDFQVGYYTSVIGLGQNPGQVVINGTIDAWNQCVGTVCNSFNNFWRSITNLTINVTGLTGCQAGDMFWAVSQDSPLRRVHINGNPASIVHVGSGEGKGEPRPSGR